MVNERYAFDTLNNRLMIKGNLVAITALRIGSGRDTNVIGNDLPVLRNSLGAPFIPGASLKGAFRARVEALVRAVAPNQVLDFEQMEYRTQNEISQLKELELEDKDLSRKIWQSATLIDLTFGSPELAGRIFFKDALVDHSLWFNQFETRNSVALNRDTETAEDQRLYDYEVVPAGSRFDFELVLENAAEWQLGMILLALKPWERGEVQIGGFRSRGLGYVRLMGPGDNKQPEVRYISVQTVDDVLSLLADGGGVEVNATQLEQWRTAFIAVLKDPKLAHEEATNA